MLGNNLTHQSGSLSYEIAHLLPFVTFCAPLVEIKVEESSDLGWCETSKAMLRLIFDNRIELLFIARNYNNYPILKTQCIDDKCNVRDATRAVKRRGSV